MPHASQLRCSSSFFGDSGSCFQGRCRASQLKLQGLQDLAPEAQVSSGKVAEADQPFLGDLEQNRELILLHKERRSPVLVCAPVVCWRVDMDPTNPLTVEPEELLAKHEQLFESMQADKVMQCDA